MFCIVRNLNFRPLYSTVQSADLNGNDKTIIRCNIPLVCKACAHNSSAKNETDEALLHRFLTKSDDTRHCCPSAGVLLLLIFMKSTLGLVDGSSK